MNQNRILQAFINRLPSHGVARLAALVSELERVDLSDDFDVYVGTLASLTGAIDSLLADLKESDRHTITQILEEEVGGPEEKFRRFQKSARLYSLEELIEMGVDAAVSFAESGVSEDAEVYAYVTDNGVPDLFIEKQGDQAVLEIANTAETAPIEGIERLERILFEWGQGEGYLN
jgi:hypothetical protein